MGAEYRPRLFIGSSVEALDEARALQENLELDADVHVWDQGTFELSGYTLESLVSQLDAGDFAAFVLRPDDVVTLRGQDHLAVRDNVLLEVGMFVGRLGRERTFLVMPREPKGRLPTDLLGLTTGGYEPRPSGADLRAALGSAANKIRQAMKAASPPRRFAGRHRMAVPSRLSADRVISPYIVPAAEPSELVHLTWEQFGQGVAALRDQIVNYGGHLNADAAIGINDAGLVMATFLNSTCLELVKLGYLRTRGSKSGLEVRPESFLPELPPNPSLLLCDFEVKSGEGLDVIVEHLQARYGDPEIYIAVFGALVRDGTRTSLTDLVAGEALDKLGLNVFVAATMDWPGIEPPLGLR